MPDDYIHHTKGGVWGHIMRRAIHVGMVLVPFAYFAWGKIVAAWFGLTAPALVIILMLLVVVFEVVRFFKGWALIGQRENEVTRISAFAWGFVGIGLTVLFAPKPYAVAIVGSCAFADPVIGELRFRLQQQWIVFVVGLIMVALVWLAVSVFFSISPWWALIMPVITVASEWPNWKWVDDNGLMMLVPLLVVVILLA